MSERNADNGQIQLSSVERLPGRPATVSPQGTLDAGEAALFGTAVDRREIGDGADPVLVDDPTATPITSRPELVGQRVRDPLTGREVDLLDSCEICGYLLKRDWPRCECEADPLTDADPGVV